MSKEMGSKLTPMVSITAPAFNSRLGRYFIGQTGLMDFGNGLNSWGGIINPYNSGVNLYIDIFTITNFSNMPCLGEILLNSNIPSNSLVSSTVTPANQGITPLKKPKAVLKFSDKFSESITSGVGIFGRIVSPNSTLVSDSHNGSIIIAPGGSFSILLSNSTTQYVKGTIVLTWWEE